MDKLFTYYNQAIERFSTSTQGLISIAVAAVLIYLLIKIVRKNLILFIIVLIIFFPVAWPAVIKIWHYLYEVIKFLIAKW